MDISIPLGFGWRLQVAAYLAPQEPFFELTLLGLGLHVDRFCILVGTRRYIERHNRPWLPPWDEELRRLFPFMGPDIDATTATRGR